MISVKRVAMAISAQRLTKRLRPAFFLRMTARSSKARLLSQGAHLRTFVVNRE
jgi:hypothetical protein